MLIDNYINIFRDTGCAYAIDGKQGGRLLSPLQQVDYRDFAANQQDWGTSWADAIGASEGWEIDITCRYDATGNNPIMFGRSYGRFMIKPYANSIVATFYCFDFSTPPTWVLESAFSGKVTSNVNDNSAYLNFTNAVFPPGVFHTLRLVCGETTATVYLDNQLVATCTGAVTYDLPFVSLSSDGNIQSITLKNSDGTTVWQAPQSELYTGWLLKPLSQVPGGATFEIQQGLLAFSGNITTDTSGTFVSSSASDRIFIPINLAGYTGSFSFLWEGDLTAYQTLFINGAGSFANSVRLWGTQESFSFSVGNDLIGVQANTQNIQLGKHLIVCVFDRDAKEISLYMDGVIVQSNPIPDDFGAVVPSATESQFGVTTSTYLSRFAFWNRALSQEEVLAL